MTIKLYKVKSSPLFKKEFSKLDRNVQSLIARFIETNLEGCTDHRHKGKALKGDKKGLWRYKITDYRLICEIKDDELIILALNIGHRREIYER